MINHKGIKVIEYSLVDKNTTDQMLKQAGCLSAICFLFHLKHNNLF